MHILMISGSRNREGRTAKAAEVIGKGVQKAGGTTELIFLPELKIERCRQCESDGWGICRDKHICIIKDDFDDIVTKIKAADAVVFANPVYFRELSESMKSFLERYRRINWTGIPRPGASQAPGPGAIKKPVIGLCMAGGGGNGAPECCVIFERIFQQCGFDTLDLIPVRRQNFDLKLPILQLTGEWLAS